METYILGTLLLLSSAMAWTDEFSTTTTSGCASQWTGACLVGWTSYGQSNSISMANVPTVGGGTDSGVYIDGTSVSPENGITYLFNVTPGTGKSASLFFGVWNIDSPNSFLGVEVTMEFLNASNVVVSSSSASYSFKEFSKLYGVTAYVNDVNVTKIRVKLGASGGLAWIDSVTANYVALASPPVAANQCAARCETNTCPAGQEIVGCAWAFYSPPPTCSVAKQCADGPGGGEKDDPPEDLSPEDVDFY